MSRIPGAPPLSAVEPPRGPWCDGCVYYVAGTPTWPRGGCSEADWAGFVHDPKDPPCGGVARLAGAVSGQGGAAGNADFAGASAPRVSVATTASDASGGGIGSREAGNDEREWCGACNTEAETPHTLGSGCTFRERRNDD